MFFDFKLLLLISLLEPYTINANIPHAPWPSNKFGDMLFGELAKQRGNIIFSSPSIHSALTLLALGAEANVQHKLFSKLFLTNLAGLEKDDSAMLERRVGNTEKSFRIVSTLFVHQSYSIRESFKTIARTTLGAVPRMVNFHDSPKAADIINEWVANETGDAIKNVVEARKLGSNTEMLIINAVYFKGNWSVQFDKSHTVSGYVFHAPERKVKCSMMFMQQQKHNLFIGSTFAALGLHFSNSDTKIVFAKPINSSYLPELERLLDYNALFVTVRQMRSVEASIGIPKLKIDSQLSLKKSISSIGLSDIFRDFNMPNMFEFATSTKVNEVYQTAAIDIDENGATAVVATTVQLVARSAPITPVFILDSPFLFFLYNSKTGDIIMKGRIENPVE